MADERHIDRYAANASQHEAQWRQRYAIISDGYRTQLLPQKRIWRLRWLNLPAHWDEVLEYPVPRPHLHRGFKQTRWLAPHVVKISSRRWNHLLAEIGAKVTDCSGTNTPLSMRVGIIVQSILEPMYRQRWRVEVENIRNAAVADSSGARPLRLWMWPIM